MVTGNGTKNCQQIDLYNMAGLVLIASCSEKPGLLMSAQPLIAFTQIIMNEHESMQNARPPSPFPPAWDNGPLSEASTAAGCLDDKWCQFKGDQGQLATVAEDTVEQMSHFNSSKEHAEV